jgi:hypothetical protein
MRSMSGPRRTVYPNAAPPRSLSVHPVIGIFTDPSGAAIGVWAMAVKPKRKPAKQRKK